MAKRKRREAKGDPLPLILIGIGAFWIFSRPKPAAALPTPTSTPRSVTVPRASTGVQVSTSSLYVKWIQETLNSLQGSNLTVDGILGPLTRAAVMTFQRSWGITVDGVVGPETDYYLRSALGLPGYTDFPYGHSPSLPYEY